MQSHIKYILVPFIIATAAISGLLPLIIQDRADRRIIQIIIVLISFVSILIGIWYKEKKMHEKINYKGLTYYLLAGLAIMAIVIFYITR